MVRSSFFFVISPKNMTFVSHHTASIVQITDKEGPRAHNSTYSIVILALFCEVIFHTS